MPNRELAVGLELEELPRIVVVPGPPEPSVAALVVGVAVLRTRVPRERADGLRVRRDEEFATDHLDRTASIRQGVARGRSGFRVPVAVLHCPRPREGAATRCGARNNATLLAAPRTVDSSQSIRD